MWTAAFWKDAAERAIKTIAQSAAALLGAAGIDLINADWLAVLATAGMAGLVSLLTSIGSATIDREGTAQLGIDTYNYHG